MDRFYTPAPDGYCGDEDNGQTSAWYVFSAMGFYPVCPGSNQYAIGSPCFPRVVIHRADGRRTLITTDHPKDPYIQQMTVNGKPHEKTFLTHRQLTSGSPVIRFRTAPQPNRKWATSKEARPYSMTGK